MLWLYYFLDVLSNAKIIVSVFAIMSLILYVLGGFIFSISDDNARGSASFIEMRAVSYIMIKLAVILTVSALLLILINPSAETAEFLKEAIIKELSNE